MNRENAVFVQFPNDGKLCSLNEAPDEYLRLYYPDFKLQLILPPFLKSKVKAEYRLGNPGGNVDGDIRGQTAESLSLQYFSKRFSSNAAIFSNLTVRKN